MHQANFISGSVDCLSIHPTSAACPGSGRGGSRSIKSSPDIPHPSNVFELLLRGCQGFSLARIRALQLISPACSGSLTSWACLEDLEWTAPRRHPNQMTETPQLTPFNVKEHRLYSQLPLDIGAPYPTISVRLSPPNSMQPLISVILFLYPNLMTIGEGRNEDQWALSSVSALSSPLWSSRAPAFLQMLNNVEP